MEVQSEVSLRGDFLWVTSLLHQPWLGRKEAGGRGGQNFTEGGGRNSVGNHSNEAMKPKPCLRTNWPDLAWSRGANTVEEVGPWLRPRGLNRKKPSVWPPELGLWLR